MSKNVRHIIKLRKAIKLRFIDANMERIVKALNEQDRRRMTKDFVITMTENEQWLVDELRRKLGYSRKTNDLYIRNSLLELAREYFKKQLI